ncbi:MAG: site-2 protease family protein [Clostridia bacterium]|nr:site-2 protease family protein [Clostridia bacterium]
MEKVFYILLAIVILLVMIVIHELGHYIVGKILKFNITEFSVGFGPKLLSKTNKKTGEKFSLRLIPLGGYCAFLGEEDVEDEKKTEEKSEGVFEELTVEKTEVDTQEVPQEKPITFNEQAPWKRILVFIAGAGFNFVSAVIFSLIFILVVGYGTPIVGEVYTDSLGNPYNQLQAGDEILAVNGKEVGIMNSFSELTSGATLGKNYTYTERRGEQILAITVTVKEVTIKDENEQDYTYNGVGMTTMQVGKTVDFGYALRYCVPYTGKLSLMILSSLGGLFTGSTPVTSVTGPVGTIDMMAQVGMMNWRNILLLLPLLASNLAIFNVLPIPALDGSKIVFAVIEWIRRKPVNRKVEAIIHTIGMLLLFGFVIVLDVLGIFI